MKKAATDTKTDIASTSEKCPEMLKLMLGDREPTQKYRTENGSFPETDGFLKFQLTNNEGFSSLQDTKSTKKQALGPKYRVINKYVKSTEQYWKERNRRKIHLQADSREVRYKRKNRSARHEENKALHYWAE